MLRCISCIVTMFFLILQDIFGHVILCYSGAELIETELNMKLMKLLIMKICFYKWLWCQ